MKYMYLFLLASPFFMISCVSSKKFKAEVSKYDSLNNVYGKLQGDLNTCNDTVNDLNKRNISLQERVASQDKQIAALKESSNQMMKQLENLSVITSSQAKSITQSLENIGAKDAYIQDLQTAMARKDSLNLALVINLKGVLGDLDDQDINIKVDKGVVYIDISDKLLFKSGSYVVTDRAKEVLGKVAQVLKNQPDIEFMVEGHTDNKPFHSGVLLDNWDLSVKRATSVVRILQQQYNFPPDHMTAAGRSEYISVADNSTPEGRAANRRTRIVILPQLDQFFKLLERK